MSTRTDHYRMRKKRCANPNRILRILSDGSCIVDVSTPACPGARMRCDLEDIRRWRELRGKRICALPDRSPVINWNGRQMTFRRWVMGLAHIPSKRLRPGVYVGRVDPASDDVDNLDCRKCVLVIK